MRKSLLLFTVLCTAFFASAQTSTFNKGDKVANAGLGLGSGYSSYYSSLIPPLSASFEMGFMDEILEKGVIGIGGYVGFSSYNFKLWGSESSFTRTLIGPRATFHYPIIDKLDTYAGLSIGLSFSKWQDTYDSWDIDSGATLYNYWFIGARYYFTDNLAAMCELGYGITYLNIGIAYKLDKKE